MTAKAPADRVSEPREVVSALDAIIARLEGRGAVARVPLPATFADDLPAPAHANAPGATGPPSATVAGIPVGEAGELVIESDSGDAEAPRAVGAHVGAKSIGRRRRRTAGRRAGRRTAVVAAGCTLGAAAIVAGAVGIAAAVRGGIGTPGSSDVAGPSGGTTVAAAQPGTATEAARPDAGSPGPAVGGRSASLAARVAEARARWATGDAASAAAVLTDALAVAPDDVAITAERNRLSAAAAALARADALAQAGNAARAADQVDAAVAAGPAPPPEPLLARASAWRAEAATAERDAETARRAQRFLDDARLHRIAGRWVQALAAVAEARAIADTPEAVAEEAAIRLAQHRAAAEAAERTGDLAAAREKLRSLDAFLDDARSMKMTFVKIAPGTFTMGSPPGEAGHSSDETPHQVSITKPFWMQTTEVTQAQWQAVMGTNPSHFTGDPNRPVEQVSWDDCQEFLARLTAKLSGGLRADLPTEAEWEYACRGPVRHARQRLGVVPGLVWPVRGGDQRPHGPGCRRRPRVPRRGLERHSRELPLRGPVLVPTHVSGQRPGLAGGRAVVLLLL